MSSQATRTDPFELIFLGTGTSSSVPHVDCLTVPSDSDKPPCRTCLSTLTPEGKRNIRRNTSAVVRVDRGGGKQVTIVIDVGKNFQAAAVEWFPKYGLRRIDAVLLTHPHADAMNGLDDLRAWTLNSTIQPFIDLYVSRTTYIEVNRAFPYLVSREYASGGGDVPEFKWHIIDEKVPFEIGETGVRALPFAVHHGRIFGTISPPGSIPTPTTLPSTPTKAKIDTILALDGLSVTTKIHPYICYGFVIQDSLVYISDVSHIPEDVWALLDQDRKDRQPYSVLVLDCLRLLNHTSHFGIKESVTAARRMGAKRTYFTGFSHDVSNEEYETILKVINGELGDENITHFTEHERRGISLVDSGKPMWMRPAFDGLRVRISRDGAVVDEGYS